MIGSASRSLDIAVHIIITRPAHRAMAQDYGHFADGSSAAFGRDVVIRGRPDTATKVTQEKCLRVFLPLARRRLFEQHFL
jgi:hypothetical protein